MIVSFYDFFKKKYKNTKLEEAKKIFKKKLKREIKKIDSEFSKELSQVDNYFEEERVWESYKWDLFFLYEDLIEKACKLAGLEFKILPTKECVYLPFIDRA